MLELKRTSLTEYRGPTGAWKKIWLKDETSQVSGAFKIRGVRNYFEVHQPQCPVITASTGNHGSAVAIIAREFGRQARIFVPIHIASTKKDRLRNAGATLVELEGTYDDCEAQARQYATEKGYLFVHSFDDDDIIDGHRSIFEEIEEDRPRVRDLFIPVGGGGLLTAALRHYGDLRRIVGVEFDEAPALYDSVIKGERVTINLTPNPVEGLCVSVVGRRVLDACMKYRNPISLVSIELLKDAVRQAWHHNGIRCELAGAAALAAALSSKTGGEECVCILSGGNIDEQLFQSIINAGHIV